MLPLYDEKSPATKPPYVVISLIAANVLIFISVLFSGEYEEVLFAYGAVPGSILAGQQLLGLIIHMFLHGGFMHIIGNMWFLWIFGDNVEFNFGRLRFLLFYFLVGLLAVMTQVLLTSKADLAIPIIGASGAISGVMGAYLVLYPKNKIRAFFLMFYYPLFFSVPAYVYIGVYFAFDFAMIYLDQGSGVAYLAHVGGFIAGAALAFLFRRKVVFIDEQILTKEEARMHKMMNK